jgi:hypothetical protein
MTMTWDGDYTFTGCVGFDVDGKWLCAELERTRVSTGVVYEVAASAEGECCDGDVATRAARSSSTARSSARSRGAARSRTSAPR